jgi:hypothetical protein
MIDLGIRSRLRRLIERFEGSAAQGEKSFGYNTTEVNIAPPGPGFIIKRAQAIRTSFFRYSTERITIFRSCAAAVELFEIYNLRVGIRQIASYH